MCLYRLLDGSMNILTINQYLDWLARANVLKRERSNAIASHDMRAIRDVDMREEEAEWNLRRIIKNEISKRDLYGDDDSNRGVFTFYSIHPRSVDDIANWAVQSGIPNRHLISPDEYHVTTTFSKTPFPLPLTLDYHPIRTDFDHHELFGPPDDQNTLVMVLKSPFLHALNGWRTALGATSDFPEYVPHISIAKGDGLGDEVDPTDLPPFTKPIVLTSESRGVMDTDHDPSKMAS